MCADVLVYNLDQWRSSDSSTDINITLFDFKEGHMTLLSHALHWAPSTCSETWSGRCSLLFCRAARRRDCVQGASTIIKYDIAREDAVRFRHLTAAQGSRASERVREERYNLSDELGAPWTVHHHIDTTTARAAAGADVL